MNHCFYPLILNTIFIEAPEHLKYPVALAPIAPSWEGRTGTYTLSDTIEQRD